VIFMAHFRSALIEGEKSGPSTPFDFKEFVCETGSDERRGFQ
jgi:Bacterial antitoxin of ParD toxin-antitoxin type II system and RHH